MVLQEDFMNGLSPLKLGRVAATVVVINVLEV